MADDLGYGDIGCYGNQRIKTPHLDHMAEEGLKFTDFHSSGTVCSPTRAGLMTGRYQQRCGVPAVINVGRYRHLGLPLEEVTFAERLKAAGYRTGVFGKWHLGYQKKFNPIHQGFDRFRGYISGNVDFHSHIDQSGVADWWNGDQKIEEVGYVTHLITKHSVDFIRQNKNRPFCLYIAHEAPHYPYQGPGDKADRTVGGKFPTLGSRKDRAAAYKEMVEELDKGVGEVLAALKKHGVDKNTLVLFFSDNGANRYGDNGKLRGHKGSVFEGGHRVPCLARWPGKIEAGRTTDQTAITLDVFPTLLDLAGLRITEQQPQIDGRSLASLLMEGKKLGDRTLFWGFNSQRAMRDGRWKLVNGVRRNQKRPMLFDLSNDPAEQHDLAEAQPERTKRMLAAIRAWDEEVGPSSFPQEKK